MNSRRFIQDILIFKRETSAYREPYDKRAEKYTNPLNKTLLGLAAAKKSNIVLSVNATTTSELLDLADRNFLSRKKKKFCTLGIKLSHSRFRPSYRRPDVARRHISDFGDETMAGLEAQATRHQFLLYEARKFVDVGTNVQKQYHGDAHRYSEWAHIINSNRDKDVVDALSQVADSDGFPSRSERGLLLDLTSNAWVRGPDAITLVAM